MFPTFVGPCSIPLIQTKGQSSYKSSAKGPPLAWCQHPLSAQNDRHIWLLSEICEKNIHISLSIYMYIYIYISIYYIQIYLQILNHIQVSNQVRIGIFQWQSYFENRYIYNYIYLRGTNQCFSTIFNRFTLCNAFFITHTKPENVVKPIIKHPEVAIVATTPSP